MGQKVIWFVFFCIFSIKVFAQENEFLNCNKPSDANNLFWCLVKMSPDVRVQREDIKVKEAGISEASQVPNPFYQVRVLKDRSGRGRNSETEGIFLHTLELGGKQGAREEVATSQRNISKVMYLNEMENAAVNIALKMYRLRQINTELDIVKENIKTYQTVLKQYKLVGRLSPEQSVSSSVYEVAQEENVLRREILQQEKSGIVTEFETILGVEGVINPNMLPNAKQDWPEITFVKLDGAKKKLVDEQVELSIAEQQLAKSKAWPNLMVGPTVNYAGGNQSASYVGIAIRGFFPLLNTNRGGRAKAANQVEKSKLYQMLQTKKLRKYAELQLKNYRSATKAISIAAKKIVIKKRHKDLHKLLHRGVVSAPLVIELHREVSDYYGRLHQQELKAVESLWALYALKGSLMDERL